MNLGFEQGYPVTLVHPSHKPAVVVAEIAYGAKSAPGEPERFPKVVVNGASQEAQYRAQGYLRFGEPSPQKKDHYEYPKVLRHPKYVPAVEERKEMRVENGRAMGVYTIPAVPAVMPDVTVTNAEQEAKARENGYKPAGEYDHSALVSALNGTSPEEGYEPQEYPKWVEDGTDDTGKPQYILVEKDPNAPKSLADPHMYPKLVNGILVSDPNAPPVVDPREFPKWVHRDGKPGDESKLANNPIEEAAIRAMWVPVPDDEELESEK